MNISERINTLLTPGYLSIVILLTGISGFVLSLYINNAYTNILPWALILGVFIYYSFPKTDAVYSINTHKNTQTILLISFFFLSSISLIVYANSGLNRTIVVHILTFLLYILVFFITILYPGSPSTFSIILFAGIIHRFMIYYSSPIYLGVDIFRHTDWIGSIVEAGSLFPLREETYFYAPFYHIMGAITELVLGISTYHSILIFSVFLVICFVMFIYSIGRIFWTSQIAILSSLLYMSSDTVIYWTSTPQTTSLGALFFLLTFYSSIKYMKTNGGRHFLLFLLGFSSLALTHQVSVFAAVIGISSFAICYAIYSNYRISSILDIGLISLLVFFIDSIITRTQVGGIPFFDQRVFVTARAFLITEGRPEFQLPQDPNIIATGAASLTEIHIIGMGLLFMYGIIGVLNWIDSKNSYSSEEAVFAMGGMVGVVSFFTFSMPVLGMDVFMVSRWFIFMYIPLSILASLGILRIISSVAKKINSHDIIIIVLICVLICPYIIFMGGNHEGSLDDPLFDSAAGAERWKITEQEQSLYQHSARYVPDETEIAGDRRSYFPLWYYDKDRQLRIISMEYGNPNSIITDDEDMVIYRGYADTNHTSFHLIIGEARYTVHGPIPIEKINPKEYSVVYENGSDQLLLSNNNNNNQPVN